MIKDTSDIVIQIAEALRMTEDRDVVSDILKYGKTPVIYQPTKKMLKSLRNTQKSGSVG